MRGRGSRRGGNYDEGEVIEEGGITEERSEENLQE